MATQRRSSVFQFQLEGVEGPRVEIGRGSYALVEEYDFKGLLVAGKSFHRNVYNRASVRERETMLKRFEIECKTLSQLHHPHIIQFLGVYVKEGSSLPVLLMERLYSTLAALIDCHGKLPDEYCYSILHDVAVALRYLHSHTPSPIIHRDLTANNILLTTDMIAKTSDVGVAEIVNLNPTHKIRVSTCPGTPSYVPPETLVARPIYAVTVDVFAYGNLMVHVFCGRWPIPTEMFRPNGITPLNEVERREEYLSNVGSMHPLMGLIRKCLSNKPVARPDVFEILSTVKEVMPRFPLSLEIKIKFFRRIQAGATYEDAVSKQPEQNKQSNSKAKQAAKENQIQAFVAQLEQLQRRTEEEREILSDAHGIKVENLHVQLNELRVEAESLKSTMRAKEVRLSAKKNEVEAKQAIIKANEQQIKTAQAIITSKEQELKLKNQELAFKEQQLTNKNMLLNAKDQEISTLHEEISRKGTNLLAKETTAASLMSQENPPPIPPRMHSLSGKGLSILYDEVPHEGNSLQATQTTKVSLKIHKRSRSDSPCPPRARSSSESKGPTNKTLTRLHSDSVLTLRQYQTSQTYKGPVPSVVVYEQEQYDDVITHGVARHTEGNASATSYTRPPPIPFPRPVQARRRKISPAQLETARNRSSQTDDHESNIIGKSFPMTPQTEEPTSPNKAEKSPEAIEEWEINRKQITLVETLGEGQFGEVWEGLWNGITRVAVKILKANILDSFAFFREAGPLKNLRHPKLLRYHAVCIEEDEILIVCELMKHGSLVLYLRGGGRTQKLPELLDISAQVAAGMCYLEKQNFVHRNLTAKNILVGEHIVCKVADFGLAAMISDDPYAAETGYNYHIRWTSPEAASYSEFTTKSDVWSFGVVLYEIITYGRPPYSGMSRKEVLDSVSSGYHMPCPTGCPDKLYDVMMECWNETPQKRPTFESLHWKLEDFNDKGYQTVH